MNEINQDLPIENTSQKKNSYQNGMILIGLIILFTGAALFYFIKPNPKQQSFIQENINRDIGDPKQVVTQASDDKLDLTDFNQAVSESEKSYAVVDQEKVVLIPLDGSGETISLDFDSGYGSGASGFGSSDPLAAPDFKKIALIDKQSKLHLVTADGKSETKVSDQLTVDYISGWSSDSKKLIFHVYVNTLESQLFPMGPGWEEPDQISLDKGQHSEGFYVLDLEAQTLTDLNVLGEFAFKSWIDESRILITLGGYQDEKIVVFNLETYVTDVKMMRDGLHKDFATQYDFSQDGSKWALTWHGGTNDTTSASIILADFPSVTGKTLMEANFAQIQGPVISPDGLKVAFRGYDVLNGPTVFLSL